MSNLHIMAALGTAEISSSFPFPAEATRGIAPDSVDYRRITNVIKLCAARTGSNCAKIVTKREVGY